MVGPKVISFHGKSPAAPLIVTYGYCSLMSLKHWSRTISFVSFSQTIGMRLSQWSAIHRLILLERASAGISRGDTWLRWVHTWIHTSENTKTDTRPPDVATVMWSHWVSLESWTFARVKFGLKRGKYKSWVPDQSPALHGSLLFPVYHSFIQIKVIWFPDLVLWINWMNPLPHLIHKGVILLIVCSHDNSVWFFFFIGHPFLSAESWGKNSPDLHLQLCVPTRWLWFWLSQTCNSNNLRG